MDVGSFLILFLIVQSVTITLYFNPSYSNMLRIAFVASLSKVWDENQEYEKKNERNEQEIKHTDFEQQTNITETFKVLDRETESSEVNLKQVNHTRNAENEALIEELSKCDDELQIKFDKSVKAIENLSANLKQSDQKMNELCQSNQTLKKTNQALNAKCEEDFKEIDILTKSNQQLKGKLNENDKEIQSLKQTNQKAMNELKKLNQELMSKCDKNCTEIQHKCYEELKEIGTLKQTNEELQTKLDENLRQSNERATEDSKQIKELKTLNQQLQIQVNGNGDDIQILKIAIFIGYFLVSCAFLLR